METMQKSKAGQKNKSKSSSRTSGKTSKLTQVSLPFLSCTIPNLENPKHVHALPIFALCESPFSTKSGALSKLSFVATSSGFARVS